MRANRQGMIQAGSGMIPFGNGMVPSGWGMVQGGSGMIPGGSVASNPTPNNMLPGIASIINMVNFSQNAFENAYWAKSLIQDATFATKTTAPDGTLTAEKFIANSTNSFHTVAQTSLVATSAAANCKYTVIVDAKAGEYTRFAITVGNGASSGVYMGFDLAGGQVAYNPATFGSGYSAGAAATIVSIGNGFYRCTFNVVYTSGGFAFSIGMDNGSGTAAISNSFAGNGTNGIYIWQVNILPTTASTIATQIYNDDFTSLSTIDTSNTKASGFNWYLGQAWPNASGGGAWATSVATQAGDLSVAGSVLTIATDRSGFGNTLATAVANGSTYTGTVFTTPFLMEFSMSFDVTQAAMGKSWPTAFSIASEFLTGTVVGGGLFAEIDILEPIPSGAGTVQDTESLHDWTVGSPDTANSNGFHANSGVTYANQNRFSRLVLTQATTGGKGIAQVYVNGVYLSGTETAYSSAAGSAPAAQPTNATGVFSDIDSQHFPFILASGTSNWAGNFDFVRVWAVNSSQKTVK